MERYAKAIVALVVVAASLFVGDEVANEINVELLEGAIITILTTASVYFVPNKPA
jgi:hypothetical protein